MEWISVEDKLPNGGDVLVSNGDEIWLGSYRWHSVDDGSWAVYMNAPFRSNSVTHWMPLPEPPKQ
jgi:hypothetical protein